MTAIPHYISPEEYLKIEHRSPIRHEYRHGLVYAMASSSDKHDRITANLLKLIDTHFGNDSTCQFFSGNVKVNINVSYTDTLFYYPDAFITCNERDQRDRDIKRHPKLIVEVLSESTQAFDRSDKFEDYTQIDTLEEYVLIAQTHQRIDCHRRTADNDWTRTTYKQSQPVSLQSIRLTFKIAQLYHGIH
ncbi:MAG: Uma2 family endonuclease [Cyanobacteria bacterium P01_D01_bin.105]